MPVKSSSSSVLKWPDAATVDAAVRAWAAKVAAGSCHVLRVGYLGSYARGDWGVGSDVDLVIVVAHTDQPPLRRASAFDTISLPIPADLLVYTQAEWEALMRGATRLGRALKEETVWVVGADPNVFSRSKPS